MAEDPVTKMALDIVVDEASSCRDVHVEARNLRNDVEKLRSFLGASHTSSRRCRRRRRRNDASSSTDHDISERYSLKRTREAIYDAEDVLDKYSLCFEDQPSLHRDHHLSFLSFLRKKVRTLKQLGHRYGIAAEIREIRARISDIVERRRDDQLSVMELEQNSSAPDPRLLALFFAESDLVGIDEPRDALIRMMQLGFGDDDQDICHDLLTISVVGMGGLGKTTLARTVYEQMKGTFQTYACVSVSQSFNVPDVFRAMILEFQKAKREHPISKSRTEVDAMTQVELIQAIRDYLQNKSFLLVLDDVWDVDVWKAIKTALPDEQQQQRLSSRVILTTRQRDVAIFCCDRFYDLKPLDREKARSLFCRRAFGSSDEDACPHFLLPLARSFIAKCRGLPLALVALGSLLSVKPLSYAEWELMYRSLGSELETDDHLKSMKSILLLSFNDLPHYLRDCFLFLSIFPEDYPIKRMKLIRLWVAEGLVQTTEGRSLEEAADGYLNQLIRRSLVQVTGLKHDETVTTCQLHDIVRDIILTEYREEGFFASLSSVLQPRDFCTVPFSHRIRRLSIYNNKGDQAMTCESYNRLTTHLRSLFVFGVDGPIPISFAGLRWLRVVDLENFPVENFPVDLTQLLLLKYLSLQNTKIKHLPNSVEKLRRLETLNLKGTSVRELPVGVLKLKHLRHLLAYRHEYYISLNPFNCISGVKVPAGIGSLRSLQKVGIIEAENNEVVTELRKLNELRRLCVSKLRRRHGVDFCAAIEKMRHLQALDVISTEEDALELQSLSCPPPNLRRVYLSGRLENIPEWLPSLQNLVSLRLCWSRLRDDPLKALQSLANLVELDLIQAYEGEELFFKSGSCPKLKLLWLEMRKLRQIRAENGAMPSIEKLTVSHCEQMVEVPFWLQQLTNIKQLCVPGMPEVFVRSLYKEGGGELADYVRHIPSIERE